MHAQVVRYPFLVILCPTIVHATYLKKRKQNFKHHTQRLLLRIIPPCRSIQTVQRGVIGICAIPARTGQNRGPQVGAPLGTDRLVQQIKFVLPFEIGTTLSLIRDYHCSWHLQNLFFASTNWIKHQLHSMLINLSRMCAAVPLIGRWSMLAVCNSP